MNHAYSLPPPYVLEDKTGSFANSDWDEIYDRIFLRVSRSPQVTDRPLYMIHDMGRRSSRVGDARHLTRSPSVIMDFTPNETIGIVHFIQQSRTVSLPIHRYLRKTSMFGSSLSRKFQASDGREYRWCRKITEGQEWSCISADNHNIAHYDFKPPHVPAFGSSGNMLTIQEPFKYLTVELLASLTMMRHIEQYNL
ncbi:hypothetical protein PLICRDRAFT_175456 [Plicaturopsis crispa FD-325 SS-3]|nr:hypothetical protein PLICRDRAFT_175456 [Plicaturopsis crispa FD-325 SS-3]